jgi:hypothetical protein
MRVRLFREGKSSEVALLATAARIKAAFDRDDIRSSIPTRR